MRRAVWIAFGVLALSLFALTVNRVADRGRFATAYSSYGSGPRGTRALFLLIEQFAPSGTPPMRWAQDLARLPQRAVLVALGGCDAAMARPVSRYERQELVRWVRAGGVLLVAGARDYVPHAFGVRFAGEAGCAADSKLLADEDEDEDGSGARKPEVPQSDPPAELARQPGVPGDSETRADAGAKSSDARADAGRTSSELRADAGMKSNDARADAGPMSGEAAGDGTVEEPGAALPPAETSWAIPMAHALRGLPVIPFRDAGELVLMPDLEPEVLLGDPRRDASGAESDVVPLALVLRHGLGRVIVLASASMLQNAELGRSDGGALFLRLLRAYGGDSPVLFDEYHLGIGERRSLMRYLRQMGAAPLALQLLLLLALFLWRAGARFGSIQQPAAAPPPGTSSFVTALGRLYERAADPTGALELIAREAWARIAAYHHVPLAAPARLAEALIARGAAHAATAVWEIDAAAKSGSQGQQRLPALIARIDAAVVAGSTPAGPVTG